MTLSACQTESIPEGSTSESLHTADVVPEDQVDLKESKELVVYRYPLLGEQLDFAVEQFKKQYPDVEIEYRDFGDASDPNASDQYAEILQGELAAGKDQISLLRQLMQFHLIFRKQKKPEPFWMYARS